MTYTLSIPRQRDPIARIALLLACAGVAWLGVSQPGLPARAEPAADVILLATPTLPSAAFAPPVVQMPAEAPTAILEPTTAPAPVVELAAPTPPPQIVYQQVIVEVPVAAEQLRDLSQDPNAAPSCATGVSDAYCGLEVQQVDPAAKPAYEPPTQRELQYSRQRTR
jgi:hypothetical protein